MQLDLHGANANFQ